MFQIARLLAAVALLLGGLTLWFYVSVQMFGEVTIVDHPLYLVRIGPLTLGKLAAIGSALALLGLTATYIPWWKIVVVMVRAMQRANDRMIHWVGRLNRDGWSVVGSYGEGVLDGDRLKQLALENWRPIVLFLVSGAAAAFYQAGRPWILYDDSDPLSYVREAWSIIRKEGGIDLAYRGPGYPIFLLLTGMASFDIWWILIPAQILMAIVMPLIIYYAVHFFTRDGAFLLGLFFISYGAAYNHMNWIMSEELFLFVQFMIIMLAAWYFGKKQNKAILYAIVVLSAYCGMIRPGGVFYYWIFLATCLLFRIEPWQRFLRPTALYCSIMFLWGVYDFYHGIGSYPGGYIPENQIQRRFAETFYGFDSYHLSADSTSTIRVSDGPATTNLYQAIHMHLDKHWGEWNTKQPETVNQLYERFRSSDELVANIFRKPNFLYLEFVIRGLQQTLGSREAHKLMDAVAAEHYNTRFFAVGRHIWAHPRIPFLGPPQTYVGRHLMSNYVRYPEIDENRYYFIGGLHQWLIREENGPASREYLRALIYMIDTFPDYTIMDTNRYLEIFGSRDAIKEYVTNPKVKVLEDGRSVLALLEGSTYVWISNYYGETKTDALMGRVALETLKRYPVSLFMFFDSFLRITIMRHANLDYGSNVMSSFSNAWDFLKNSVWCCRDMRSTILPERLAKYLVVVNDFNNPKNVILMAQYYFIWRILKYLWFILMLLVVGLLLLLPHTRALTGFIFALYWYNVLALTAVLGNFELPRYEDVFLFFPVIISVLGMFCVPQAIAHYRAHRVIGQGGD